MKKIAIFLAITCLMLFLRFFHFNQSPPSPYWEEVALAYDAYSIAQTAKDHHGNFLPLVAFESFGDFKPSLYFYLAVPFIKIFGLNVLAIRLPTVLSSIAIIFGIAFLAKNLFQNFYLKNDSKAANFIFYLALFLASLSPWLLTFSRSAWESTVATALILWGSNFWLCFMIKNKSKWAILAVIFLVLSTYAYHAARITAPLVGLALMLAYLKKKSFFALKKPLNLPALLIAMLLAVGLFWPVGQALLEKTGQQRIAETSIFSDITIIEKSNQLKAEHHNSLFSRIIYHRYLLFAEEAAANFLDHFNFTYLFVSGDHNPRHSIQTFGEFYYFDLLFFAAALVFCFRHKNRITWFLFFGLCAAILPAAFTQATPHALRTLAALPIFLVFLSFGVWQFLQVFKNAKQKKIVLCSIVVIYLLFAASFFYQLIYVYPNRYKSEWQFGYEEMIKKLLLIENNYEKIYITREQGRPAMYYFFYAQVDPILVQAFAPQAKKDQGEFLNFSNIEFIDKSDQIDLTKKDLIISSPNFYQRFLVNKNLTMIDQTQEQSWVFYENK
jgi:4-amino-4-deoxy-L-arabinose transferase-like glycosyltransferase